MGKKHSRMKLLNQSTSRTVPGAGVAAITDARQGSHFCAYDGNGKDRLGESRWLWPTAQYEYGPSGGPPRDWADGQPTLPVLHRIKTAKRTCCITVGITSERDVVIRYDRILHP